MKLCIKMFVTNKKIYLFNTCLYIIISFPLPQQPIFLSYSITKVLQNKSLLICSYPRSRSDDFPGSFTHK